MKFQKAKLELTHDDILKAVRSYVARQGWEAGDVRIVCHPHQHNGPDTYSAAVEVETNKREDD